ncbi:DUF4412 domain-containing protein [Lichenicoccus sp.]|uniref:DUF4412 domain-containing protein n=1 Tax=Lichenicoccus sp. TaxID=2781899 RepID=UPI003D10E18D
MRPSALLLSPVAGVALLAMLTPAHAADKPRTMPTRDVKVVYDVQPQGAPAPQQITVWFADGLMRIDSPDGRGETILDRDRHLLTIVMNSARVYMQVPERQSLRSPFLLDPSMNFERAGTGVVAGLPCTRWNITANGGKATACITADGVLLSEEGVDQQGARGKLEAQQVVYGPIPAATFAAPSGYSRVAHPEGPDAYERGGAQQSAPALGAAPAGKP